MTEHVYEETDVGLAIRERITRCRDCARAEGAYNSLWCTAPLGSYGMAEVIPDDFCSEGWPREEGK